MNYQTLFKGTGMSDGGENFRCLYYSDSGLAQLECNVRFPMLFVLQGALEMRFKYSACSLGTGNLAVIDRTTLTEFRTTPSTVVLLYHPPKRLEEFLTQCSKAYDTCFSQVVPILPTLQAWIDSLLEQHLRGVRWEGESAHEQRKELARIFMAYPHRELGELHAVFAACALGDCKKCQQGLFTASDNNG